jgi:hypothetical protein
MFAGRFFATRFFAERYFAKIGGDNTDKSYGYFPNGAFAKRYFTQSYFPGSRFSSVGPPAPTGDIFDYIITFRRRRR